MYTVVILHSACRDSRRATEKQLKNEEGYKFLPPIYGLGIFAEIYEKTTPDWYHHYQLVKKNDTFNADVIEHLQLVFIELPKFPIQPSEEKKLRLLWLRFLREIDEKTTTVSKDLLEIPEIVQALELAEESAYTPRELNLYESYWDQVSREKTLIMDKYAEGKVEGKVEIAINMLRENRPFDGISLFTGLFEEAIAKLKG